LYITYRGLSYKKFLVKQGRSWGAIKD
jgi:hypothetical protein